MKKPYTAILEEAWVQSQLPREPDAPTVISTFAGGGGSSLGYHMAGFRELLAVEWDDNAVKTLRLNFPHLDVYHGDIAKLSVEEVLRRTGLEPGQLDVFDGSPPCQGFSTAGKRDMGDERNQLFREYVRLLRGLKPKCFVMENVSGMVKGKMKLIFAEILRELKASGYLVSARLLNAKYYGVPQSRERIIFVGVREDLGIEPSHPEGTTNVETLTSAWANVCVEVVPEISSRYANIVLKVSRGQCADDVEPGSGFQNCVRWDENKCAPTISKLNRGTGFGTPIHPIENRTVSIPEAKRCASFPDNHVFVGAFADRWARIGNSVPPLLMRAIAGHIRSHILERAKNVGLEPRLINV